MSDVRATLHIQIYVECPECGEAMDLMDPRDTNNIDHNDDNGLMDQACPTDGRIWMDAHKDFECEDVMCGGCGHEFDVKGLDW